MKSPLMARVGSRGSLEWELKHVLINTKRKLSGRGLTSAPGNRASGTLIRFVQDLDKVGDYAWGAATLAFLFHSLDSRCRLQLGCKSLRGFVPILQIWVWEHIIQCRPERLLARLSCTPRASQWYLNANLRSFADILPPEMAERIKALGIRPGEQGYRFILNELKNHEVIWQPYRGGPDDETAVVQEGRTLFERDIRLHAPQEEIPAVARDWQARPSSEGRGEVRAYEGTSECVASDAESILRGETLRLSHLVEKKDTEIMRLRALLTAERERRQENEAIIEALADSCESNREQDMSEVTRIRLESDLFTLQAEVDRLGTSEAEARGERDGAFVERATSMAQVDELRARLRSFEAPAQGGAIVASIPPPPSWGEEKAIIHDHYARRMDRMERQHDEVVTDLRVRLARLHRRAEERGYAFSDSTHTPSQRAPGLTSFASSARRDGAVP
ncbi:hypothetical protein AAC387_Pa11g0734 [Persea americana]